MLSKLLFSLFKEKISEESFLSAAQTVFNYQVEHNPVYRSWCRLFLPQYFAHSPNHLSHFPFLPIAFFRTKTVLSSQFKTDSSMLFFESSGTTDMVQSKHFIPNPNLYKESFLTYFQQCYGNIEDYCILGLLPNYLERKNASLIFMVAELIKKSNHQLSDFYLDDFEKLNNSLAILEAKKQPTLLIGVTYALIDFAAEYPQRLTHTIVMETGGMKGRKKEWTRMEVHQFLKKQFRLQAIHSEYGMTELLSQAYAIKDGLYKTPAWMKVFVRDLNDPKQVSTSGEGQICIIDLANLYTCAFIETEDLGRVYEDGSFEILGRKDAAVLRGCSLLAV